MIHLYVSLPPPDWKIRDLAYSLMILPFSVKKKSESVIAALYGVEHVLLTNLGRTALIAGLKAASLEGQGVLIPAVVCPTVIRAILKAGCVPILADVEDNLHVSVKTLEAAFCEDVKAVLVPHLYGLHCPIEEIKAWAGHKKLFLIDDAAQAVGRKYQGQYLGTFGDMGILSFGPFKSIGISRGGVLMSHDTALIERAEKIPFDPEPIRDVIKRLISCIIKLHYRPYFLAVKEMLAPSPQNPPSPPLQKGGNAFVQLEEKEDFALSKIEAGLILRGLKRAESVFSERRKTAQNFIRTLDKKICEPVGSDDIPYVKIPIRLKNSMSAAEAVTYLRSLKIEAEQIYMPLHLQNAYRSYAHTPLPKSEELWNTVILVPNSGKVSDVFKLYP